MSRLEMPRSPICIRSDIDIDYLEVVIISDEDVLWLDISVDHVLSVKVLEPLSHLLSELPYQCFLNVPFLHLMLIN